MFGNEALETNSTGYQNVAIGYKALSLYTGNANVAMGNQALEDCSTGGQNVAVGHDAGRNITTGAYNTILGYASLDGSSSTTCLLYTSPSPRDRTRSRMPSSA